MADPRNGNLSSEERAALKPGTRVVWQSERGAETTDVVHHVTSRAVVMDNGAQADGNAFCRLADWQPARGPEKAPAVPTPAGPAKDAGAPRRVGSAFPRADRDSWLVAVQQIRAAMASGKSRYEAVAQARQDHPALCMTPASYGWWLSRFIREGAIVKGPRIMPKRAKKTCPDCAANRTEAGIRKGIADAAMKERDAALRDLAVAKQRADCEHCEDLARALAERDEARGAFAASKARICEHEADALARSTPGWTPADRKTVLRILAAILEG